ncbi:MAG: hypothetical protein KDB07_13760, partial [Planctomycetes bacterium]|nr:hypothetical protein [Planctomycetota bacterium]
FLRRQREAEGQAYNAGWVFDYPDAQNILVLLYGKNAVPSGVNSARYKSAEFDKLYDEMNQLDQTDPEQAERKKEVILEMHKVLEHDCPWALIYFGKTYLLTHDWFAPPMPNDFAYNLIKYHASDSNVRAAQAEEWREVKPIPMIILGILMLLFGGLFVAKVLMQP